MTEKEGYLFLDAGKDLSDKNGKINGSLFIDGSLHPNEKGYAIIGKLINN
jgi:lysophospholipase L1-like esterase